MISRAVRSSVVIIGPGAKYDHDCKAGIAAESRQGTDKGFKR